MRFKDTYVKIGEAVLKHPTQEDIDRRFASHYKDADIMTAAKEGVYERVKELLDKGENVNMIEDDKTTALMWASYNGHTDIVKLLLDRGADVNIKDNSENTALIYASTIGHTDIVGLLLDKGADVNVKNIYGYTALIWASTNGHSDIVNLLKKHGAKLNEAVLKHPTKEEGEARLAEYMSKMDWFDAAREGYGNIIADRLKQGQDINAVDRHKESALHYAVLKMKYDIVRLLLEKGADPDIENIYGNTPLMAAGIFGHKYAAHQLIGYGANMDKVNSNGNTALMLAVLNGRKYMVEYLMERGADINIMNKFGETALDIAMTEEYWNIADMLEKAGAIRGTAWKT